MSSHKPSYLGHSSNEIFFLPEEPFLNSSYTTRRCFETYHVSMEEAEQADEQKAEMHFSQIKA